MSNNFTIQYWEIQLHKKKSQLNNNFKCTVLVGNEIYKEKILIILEVPAKQ